MKNRFFALFAVTAFVLHAFGAAAFADTKTKTVNNQTSQLIALLPGSDMVMTFDAKRFFGDALPQILSGNQPLLANVLSKVDEVKTKAGIDLRQFEQIAVGLAATRVSAKEYDFEPVVIARGQINANALLSLAKVAAGGKYREEKVGDRIVYVFAAKEIAAAKKPVTTDARKADAFERMIGKLSKEIAVTAYDQNTLAFGMTARVRQTLEGKTRVGADLTALIYDKQTAVMNFAAKVPSGMSAFLPLDNDELGKNIDAIRYLYGAMDVTGADATVQLTAKTAQAAQAQGLFETLQGLQMVGKAFLGGAKTADKQVYERMIENAKFSRNQTEVTLDLAIAQSDIDVLIGAKK